MYACRHWTINSKNVRAIPNRNENGEKSFIIKSESLSMYSPPKIKTKRSKWPANIFAKRRSESVNGRTRKNVATSIGVRRM
jgi:hypothetical protein